MIPTSLLKQSIKPVLLDQSYQPTRYYTISVIKAIKSSKYRIYRLFVLLALNRLNLVIKICPMFSIFSVSSLNRSSNCGNQLLFRILLSASEGHTRRCSCVASALKQPLQMRSDCPILKLLFRSSILVLAPKINDFSIMFILFLDFK